MSKYRPRKFLGRQVLQRILRAFDCTIDKKRGDGSHWSATRATSAGIQSYALPFRRDYGRSYLNPLRRRLELSPEDGVTDREFYTKA